MDVFADRGGSRSYIVKPNVVRAKCCIRTSPPPQEYLPYAGMRDLNGEIKKVARKAREFWMALDQKVSKWSNGIDECESSSHNNTLLTSNEVSP
ncbi:hypothetical protein Ancab_011774 [Ancistrocladus abbreviatus]